MEISKKIGMRLLSLLVCLLCVLALVLPISAATPIQYNIHTLTAPVYREPSADALVIGLVQNGSALSVLGSVGEFYKIDCYGMTGFLHKDQVSYRLPEGFTVNCTLKRSETAIFPLRPAARIDSLKESVMTFSHDLLGVPYVYGGKSPWGFDCSGFVSYVYENHGISIHRCADEQMQDGLIVAREELQPGDLVFFSVYGPWLASHVGIYIGGGKMIHASSSRGICISSLDSDYWASTYVGARRLLIADPANTGSLQPLECR